MKTQEIVVTSHIVFNKTRLWDGMTLKQKIEDKFKKVNITNVVVVLKTDDVSVNSIHSKNDNRSDRVMTTYELVEDPIQLTL